MGQQISRYEIISEIGSGGFSTVYAAHDPLLDREVALKIMRPLLMSDPDFVTRFQREAQVAANLQHPNIVPIYDYGEYEGRLFLVMKRMQSSLTRLLEDGPLEWEKAVEMVSMVAAGLDFAHARDVIHRDIKPDNILLEEETNTTTVADFGIVKALGRSTITLSLGQGVLGTPAYISPEIWNGEPATPGSDIYALACVLFEMVTGEKLFEGPTPPATMTLHFRPPKYPEEWPDGVPPGLTGVLNQALAREPEQRYRSAGAFVDALRALALDPLAEDYDALQKAVSAKDWAQAVLLAEAILTQNAGYKDASRLLQQALEAQTAQNQAELIKAWRDEAQNALSAGDWEMAIAAAQQWLQLAPDDEARQILDQAKAEQEKEMLAAAPVLETVVTSPVPPVDEPALEAPEKREEPLEVKEEEKPAPVAPPVTAIKAEAAAEAQPHKRPPSRGPADAQAAEIPAEETKKQDRKKIVIIAGLAAGLLIICIGIAAVIINNLTPEPAVVEHIETEVTRVVTEVVEVVAEVTRVVTEVVEVEAESGKPAEEAAPVGSTLYWNWVSEPPQADPALATDTTSIDLVGNTFVALTKLDPVSGEVLPNLAYSWEVAEDGEGNQTWTFYLRDDIPWVRYDTAYGEVVQDLDRDGNPRFVLPSDVEYSVKRAIDPETASDYVYVLYVIKNAQAVNGGSEELTLDDVGVSCDDGAGTCTFTLEYDAPYFPSIASMWVTMPVPIWTIEEYGEKWTEPGLAVSSGPYVMSKWVHGGELDMVKNPFWPEADSVQIEQIKGQIIPEESTAFAMYQAGDLDTVPLPLAEIDRVKADPALSQEFYSAPAACTYYYGFTNTKPPFDDPRVRRAFSQAIDRQSLIDNVTKGGQIPATSFAPPGVFGAPAPGSVGLGFDPEAAQIALQEYLAEQGMTIDDFNAMDIVLMHNTSEGHARIAEAIQQMWLDFLGVEVRIESQDWAIFLSTIRNTTPVEEMPHIWRLGWCADYADENNWVHEVFNSDASDNRLRRNCLDPNCSQTTTSYFDELTYFAAQEQDPGTRAEYYREAERVLAEEEAAYAPIYHYSRVWMTRPWLERDYPSFGWNNFADWTIDVDAR